MSRMPGPGAQDGLRILVVEDNELNVRVARRWMRRLGHEMSVAMDGMAGVDAALDQQPDVVLMDISLPRMDGLEATRTLRADARGRHLVIVGVSAHALVQDREAALAAGCDTYFTKPIDFRALDDTVRSLVADRRSEEDPPC